jgi:hypothetical protein
MPPFSHQHSSELGCCVGEKSIRVRERPCWQEICRKHSSDVCSKARRVRVDKTSHDPWDDDLATSSVPRNLGQPSHQHPRFVTLSKGPYRPPATEADPIRLDIQLGSSPSLGCTPLQFPVGSAQRLRNPLGYRYDDNLPCPLHHDFLLSAYRQ